MQDARAQLGFCGAGESFNDASPVLLCQPGESFLLVFKPSGLFPLLKEAQCFPQAPLLTYFIHLTFFLFLHTHPLQCPGQRAELSSDVTAGLPNFGHQFVLMFAVAAGSSLA